MLYSLWLHNMGKMFTNENSNGSFLADSSAWFKLKKNTQKRPLQAFTFVLIYTVSNSAIPVKARLELNRIPSEK